jgi:hypothetical protein
VERGPKIIARPSTGAIAGSPASSLVPATVGRIEYLRWLASLPPDLVWLPDAAEERALFEAVRTQPGKKSSALGAYVLRG